MLGYVNPKRARLKKGVKQQVSKEPPLIFVKSQSSQISEEMCERLYAEIQTDSQSAQVAQNALSEASLSTVTVNRRVLDKTLMSNNTFDGVAQCKQL